MKSLKAKVETYAKNLLKKCPNQSGYEITEDNGIIILTTKYHDREDNVVEIQNEHELKQLKYYDSKDLKKGYLV